MKFILSGRMFDSATSAAVAVSRGAYTPHSEYADFFPAEQVRFEETLYRTPSGVFWLHKHSTAKYQKGKPVVSDTAQELTAEESLAWVQQNSAVILDAEGLPEVPPA
jgi:hypothetical protein